MRRLFQFAFYYVDTRSLAHNTHTHTERLVERDKILIRNTTQRHLDV